MVTAKRAGIGRGRVRPAVGRAVDDANDTGSEYRSSLPEPNVVSVGTAGGGSRPVGPGGCARGKHHGTSSDAPDGDDCGDGGAVRGAAGTRLGELHQRLRQRLLHRHRRALHRIRTGTRLWRHPRRAAQRDQENLLSLEQRGRGQRVALRHCGPHGNDYKTAVWFHDACGAVATGGARTAFWRIGDGIGAARASALGKCRTGGGDRCAIAVSACSR